MDFDYPAITETAAGYAAIWHDKDHGHWNGPPGFWDTDARAPLAPEESKTWQQLYVWADPKFFPPDELMHLAIQGEASYPPPPDRDYFLELTAIPAGISGAPPLGTIWHVPLKGTLVVDLPAYRTWDGRTGYEFSFTMTAEAPEPGTGLLLAAALLLRRRRA